MSTAKDAPITAANVSHSRLYCIISLPFYCYCSYMSIARPLDNEYCACLLCPPPLDEWAGRQPEPTVTEVFPRASFSPRWHAQRNRLPADTRLRISPQRCTPHKLSAETSSRPLTPAMGKAKALKSVPI